MYYRVFFKYCVFFPKILWFFWTLPVLLQRWCSSCLVCVHTLTLRANRERPESGIFWNLRKKTQYLMNTLYQKCVLFLTYSLFCLLCIIEVLIHVQHTHTLSEMRQINFYLKCAIKLTHPCKHDLVTSYTCRVYL